MSRGGRGGAGEPSKTGSGLVRLVFENQFACPDQFLVVVDCDYYVTEDPGIAARIRPGRNLTFAYRERSGCGHLPKITQVLHCETHRQEFERLCREGAGKEAAA